MEDTVSDGESVLLGGKGLAIDQLESRGAKPATPVKRVGLTVEELSGWLVICASLLQ